MNRRRVLILAMGSYNYYFPYPVIVKISYINIPCSINAYSLRGIKLSGSTGTIGKARNTLLQSRLIERIDAVLPMPDAPVMLALLDRLAA